MGPLEALWHLGNLLAVAVMTGWLSALAVKLLWRRELAAVPWRPLAGYAVTGSCIVMLAGLFITGRDGRMATYAAMVLCNALTLWWRGFGPGRSEPHRH
jgi:hypothetical protein